MRRLERLLAIALFLAARRRVRASGIAERFGVSLRTVYRDVNAMQEAGFPVQGNAGDGYRFSQEGYLRPLALNEAEAEALTIAARSLAASAGGSLRDALAAATAKLEASLTPPARRRIAQLERRIATPEFSRATSPTAAMLDAIRELHLVAISYCDPRSAKKTRRTIEPLGLVCLGEAWWLVAWCRLRSDARAFRVDCVAGWQRTGRFAPRAGFSFEDVVRRDRHLAQKLFGY